MNLRLIALFAGTASASLMLAGAIHVLVQARAHIKAHGLLGGLMEWWLYGRRSNWGEAVLVEVRDETDLIIEEMRAMWDEGTPVALRRSDHVKSVRLSALELEHLRAAAAMRGLTLGQYIKRAAIQQASDDRQQESVTATAGFGHVIAGRVPPV